MANHPKPISLPKKIIEIIDATCPVVLRLQKRIKQEYMQEDLDEKQIVIYGKNGHAEVLGLVGQTTGKAIVIEKLDEARRLDFSKSIRLYSQTTKSLDEFWEIVEYIKEHISPDVTFEYYDTICRQVANRMPNLRKFAASHDLIFFVSGKKSSNGKMLFEECKKVNPNSAARVTARIAAFIPGASPPEVKIPTHLTVPITIMFCSNGKMLFEECKKVNPNSHLIDSADEIDDSLLPGVNSIGVCGATSTPKWLMEEISEAIKAQIKRQ